MHVRVETLAALALLALAIAATGAAGATGATGAADDLGDLRATLRAHLRDPRFALDGRPEYVVTDAAVVEPALDHALARMDATRPLDPTRLERAKALALTAFREQQAATVGLRALEARIRERFAHPVITRVRAPGSAAGEAVTLDLGWMPGELAPRFAGVEMRGQGENFADGRPSTVFMARTLAAALREHRQAQQLTLRFLAPRFGKRSEYVLTYRRGGFPDSRRGWVQLSTRNAVGLVGPYEVPAHGEDFGPYLAERFSFYQNCAELLYSPRSSLHGEALRQLRGKCVDPVESVSARRS